MLVKILVNGLNGKKVTNMLLLCGSRPRVGWCCIAPVNYNTSDTIVFTNWNLKIKSIKVASKQKKQWTQY